MKQQIFGTSLKRFNKIVEIVLFDCIFWEKVYLFQKWTCDHNPLVMFLVRVR